MSEMHTIAIVGAGYSGTLCAVNLLRQHVFGRRRIVLIERHTRAGRGLAYRTWDDNFVLNVPAGNMSALADDTTHFVRYCQSIDPAFNTGSFVSRRIYGDISKRHWKRRLRSTPPSRWSGCRPKCWLCGVVVMALMLMLMPMVADIGSA